MQSETSPQTVPQQRQACKRCFKRKRKCDKQLPSCGNCIRAETVCEPEERPEDRLMAMEIQAARDRCAAAEARVAELEAQSAARALGSPSGINGGELADASFSTVAVGILGISGRYSTVPLPPHVDNLSCTDSPFHFPTEEAALDMVHHLFASHKQIYHSLQQEQLAVDMRRMYEPGGLVDMADAYRRSRYMALMVLCITTWGTDAGPNNTPGKQGNEHVLFRTLALKELSFMLQGEDLVAIQALILLATLTMLAPGGPSYSQLVGMASRTALALGINRKDDVYLASCMAAFGTPEALDAHNEWRKNVFWALYSLDRVCVFILGKPPAIRDQDIDVDPLKDDKSSPFMSSIAIRNQTIQGRRLYGRVQEALYGITVKPISAEEAEPLITDLVTQVDEWYQSSPLKQAFARIDAAAIQAQLLDDLRYHHLMIAIHRPSPLIPNVPSRYIQKLHHSAGLCIDLYVHYTTSGRLTVNWVHLYEIFVAGTALIYSFREACKRPNIVAFSPTEVDARVAECRGLMQRHSGGWTEAQRFLDMFNVLAMPFEHERSAARGEQIPDLLAAATGAPEIGVPEEVPPDPGFDLNALLGLSDNLSPAGTAGSVVRGLWSQNHVAPTD